MDVPSRKAPVGKLRVMHVSDDGEEYQSYVGDYPTLRAALNAVERMKDELERGSDNGIGYFFFIFNHRGERVQWEEPDWSPYEWQDTPIAPDGDDQSAAPGRLRLIRLTNGKQYRERATYLGDYPTLPAAFAAVTSVNGWIGDRESRVYGIFDDRGLYRWVQYPAWEGSSWAHFGLPEQK